MKRLSLTLFLFIALASPAAAWRKAAPASVPAALSQFTSNFLGYGGDYLLLNRLKEFQRWTYGDNQGWPAPIETDNNGYPLAGSAAMTSHGGVYSISFNPSQAERPGNYAASGLGSGTVGMFDQNGDSGSVACFGVTSGNNNILCSNAGCSTFTGSIAPSGNNGILTVTAAPTGTGCTLTVGLPFTGSGVTLSSWGIPTQIIGKSGSSNCGTCTGTGGTGTYLVNFAQTVGSETLTPGWYFVNSAAISGHYETTVTNAEWTFSINATATGPSSNPIQYAAIYHINDQLTYAGNSAKVQLVGTLFKQRIKQGNFKYWRDLNISASENGTYSTWDTRMPIGNWSYNAPHMLNAASGQGMYVDAAGDGASGCTVSYNSGSDLYSVTCGSGNWTDKQTLIINWPSTGTTSSTVSLNGNAGVGMAGNNGGNFTPTEDSTNEHISTMVYDAVAKSLIAFPNEAGMNGAVAPEVFIELNSEVGTNPRFTGVMLAADPLTDWQIQEALYIKANYPALVPWWETPNELFNCNVAGVAGFSSLQSRAYISADPTHWSNNVYCGSGGDNYNWGGKVASVMGQALAQVFGIGNLGTAYHVSGNTQTGFALGNDYTAFGPMVTAASYVNQNSGLIPTQSGCAGATANQTDCPAPFLQSAANNWINRVDLANYWNTSEWGTQAEVADGYNYFYGNSTQQATAMSNVFATQTINVDPAYGTNTLVQQIAAWYTTFVTDCGTSSAQGSCGKLAGLAFYEGTYVATPTTVDETVAFTATSTSGSNCVLTVAAGNTAGAVAGQPIAVGAYTGAVVSASSGGPTITISGACSTYGSPTSGTMTYTGSHNYVSYFREWTYLNSQLTTLTTLLYQQALLNGGVFPAQFTLAGALEAGNTGFKPANGYPWMTWSFDIYGYFTVAQSTSTTTSTNTATLGGTVTGIFTNGTVLFGEGIANLGNGASGNTTVTGCTLGSGNSAPCGSTAGDILTLSQNVAANESAITITANVAPSTTPAGTGSAICQLSSNANDQAACATNSPVGQWPAIRTWNGSANL